MPPKKKSVAAAAAATTATPKPTTGSGQRPFISVLTPTYNRRMFIPISIACFKAQTYPMDRIEWIILDDGSDPVEDLFAASGLTNVRYYREDKKLPIGAKRNKINELARGEICVCWDDDDYYPPDRIRHAVQKLQGNRRAPVAGSSEVFLYFSDRDEIWAVGPYNPNHATNGTMAYWRTYFGPHRYDDTAEKAEERQFMDDWKTPVIQIRPEECMLVLCHPYNTFDKRKMLETKNPTLRKQSIKMRTLVKDKMIRDFYFGLAADYKRLDAERAAANAAADAAVVAEKAAAASASLTERMQSSLQEGKSLEEVAAAVKAEVEAAAAATAEEIGKRIKARLQAGENPAELAAAVNSALAEQRSGTAVFLPSLEHPSQPNPPPPAVPAPASSPNPPPLDNPAANPDTSLPSPSPAPPQIVPPVLEVTEN